MPNALILSSHAASSRVGGTVQALALAGLGIEPILIPTVLFGRHPGWGPPGGAVTPPDTVQGMLDGVRANGVLARVDLVITGYMPSPEHALIAAHAIDAVRAQASSPLVIVDPIMGDEGKGLYVAADAAEAIAGELVPRADLVAPNAWEMARLTGHPITDAISAVAAARALGKPALVSSVPAGGDIGVAYVDGEDAWLTSHARVPSAPSGTGDLLTALFAAYRMRGTAETALARAVAGLAEAIDAARAGGLPDLPVTGLGGRPDDSITTVRIARVG